MTPTPFPQSRLRPSLAALVLAWALTVVSAGALESLATTEVMAVEGSEVVLGAGRIHGLAVAAQVILLREGDPIVHPLTGEILGIPQEPVGTVDVFEVSEHRARGGIVKMYSEPAKGDLAEFHPVESVPTEAVAAVSDVMKEMKALRKSVEQVRQREDGLKSYPAFTRKVYDELAAMRSYLVSLDERLVELEEQQSEDHFRLTSVLSGEYRREDLKEFTIRYAPDTSVRLRAVGKTLLIDVVGDSLRIAEDMTAPVAMMELEEDDEGSGLLGLFGLGGDDDDDEVVEVVEDEVSEMMDEAAAPWYRSAYHLAAGIGLALALAIMVGLVIKRRYSDVMDGLEDFDGEYEGYLEDEDEDEDEDDDE